MSDDGYEYVALVTILENGIVAYQPGDHVPALNVAQRGYTVAQVALRSGMTPAPSVPFGSGQAAYLSATYVPATIIAGTGIDPTGVSDSTAAIQAVINAAADSAHLYLPVGLYKLTAPLVITKNLRITGGGVTPCFQSRTAYASSFDFPSITPWLRGSVLLQTTAATDAIQITGSGIRVDLENFGIRFADAIRHVNTGHGINATPSQTIGGRTVTDAVLNGTTTVTSATASFVSGDKGSILAAPGIPAGATIVTINSGTSVTLSLAATTSGSGVSASITGYDHGIFNATWRNVVVFGHDGNHYGFYLVNGCMNRWDQLRTFGGGGFWVQTASNQGNYGNLCATDTWAEVYVGGTAHGYGLQGNGGGAAGKLNLISFTRVQAVIEPHKSAIFSEVASDPTTAQKLFTTDAFGIGTFVGNLSILAPDFESPVTTSAVNFTMISGFIDTSGIYGGASGTVFFTAIKNPATNVGQNKVQYMDGRWAGKNASAGAPTAGANAGGSPPSPVAGTDNSDERGLVTFGTGTGPAAGVLARVPFSASQGGNQRVMLTSINAATSALGIYCTHDATGINVCAANAPSASQANTVYGVEYLVMF